MHDLAKLNYYVGWMKQKDNLTTACRFTKLAPALKPGDEITDNWGITWIIDCITYDSSKDGER